MKFLSLLLIACMLFLSYAGTVKSPMAPGGKKMCCNSMAGLTGKSACQHNKTDDQNHNCDKQGCAMMLSCSTCGFLAVEPLQFQPGYSNYIPKPVDLYKIGDLSSYHPSYWKPPKTC